MPLRNAPRSNVRSGRFFASNVQGANEITIIKPVEGTIYRVFNSGPNTFKIESGGASLPIRPKCSIDFKAPDTDITVTTAQADKEVRGSYDIIEGNDRPKNGRFRLAAGQASSRIVTNDVKGFYRIFNDRDSNPLHVKIGADLIDPLLPPGSSMDLKLPPKNLAIVNTNDTDVSGSYVRFSKDGFRPDADERPGRFQGAAKVIHGLSAARAYRFFNAGTDTVQIDDDTAAPIDLLPKCSIDANFQNATVNGGKGFYEQVRLIELQRIGRCTFVATQDNEEHLIVKNASDEFYRVLNSGSNLFKLSIDGTVLPVGPGMSLDFLPSEGHEIKVIAPSTDDEVEAIYDKLDRSVDVRSGRFIGDFAPESPRKIVSVGKAALGATPATYRFLNASTALMQIYVGGTAQVDGGLKHGQSIDLKVAPSSDGSDADISVSALAANIEIDGIYEFVHR